MGSSLDEISGRFTMELFRLRSIIELGMDSMQFAEQIQDKYLLVLELTQEGLDRMGDLVEKLEKEIAGMEHGEAEETEK
ncbi:MAG: hypothetical protein RR446_08755 [Lachnospiraceae bacterium]